MRLFVLLTKQLKKMLFLFLQETIWCPQELKNKKHYNKPISENKANAAFQKNTTKAKKKINQLATFQETKSLSHVFCCSFF